MLHIYACCKHMFQSVFRCFIRMFASVLLECCTCLQWFSNFFQVFSQVFQTLVSSVSSVFFCILQVLYIDVAKVDRDVAHIVMVIHVCFKCIFQMFHLFQKNVASGLSRCCKKWIWMLHIHACCKHMF